MNKSESLKELSAALAKAQAAMPPVKMNATNPFLKNKYADLGAVIDTSRPVLAKHGLSVSQLVFTDADRVGVETILMHESGEWMSASASLSLGDERGKSMAQVAGSVITYLRRYGLSSILGMYADEDGDGNGNGHNSNGQPPARTQPQTQPAATNGNGNGKAPTGPITPQMIVEHKLADNIPNAVALMNKLNINGKRAEEFWTRIELYRAWRDGGKDADAAAIAAIAGEIPQEG